jgi:phage virion morphogenesis protein
MAGVSLSVELRGLPAVQGVFNQLVLAMGDLGRPMDDIGSMLVASTIDRFEKGVGPDGRPWAVSERARTEGGRTLVDSARLRSSVTHLASPRQVAVGTNTVYARIHQEGGRAGRRHAVNLPARPFLGVSAQDEVEIGAILANWLAGKLK